MLLLGWQTVSTGVILEHLILNIFCESKVFNQKVTVQPQRLLMEPGWAPGHSNCIMVCKFRTKAFQQNFAMQNHNISLLNHGKLLNVCITKPECCSCRPTAAVYVAYRRPCGTGASTHRTSIGTQNISLENHCGWPILRGYAWLSGRTSVFGRRTFHVLRLTCSWRVTTYVGKPSAMGQPTRPTQPFIPSGSIDE